DPTARHDDFGGARQRVHRGGRGSLPVVADRSRPHSVRHHLHCAGVGQTAADPARAPSREGDVMEIYSRRRLTNWLVIALSVAATAFGLLWLVLVLSTLLINGVGAISLSLFAQMTPPPGSSGGLLNAIAGSLVMTFIATLIGTPTGILAGTFLAEYARGSRFGEVVRFVN